MRAINTVSTRNLGRRPATRMVWLVDPDTERVTVITQSGPYVIVGRDDVLTGGEFRRDCLDRRQM